MAKNSALLGIAITLPSPKLYARDMYGSSDHVTNKNALGDLHKFLTELGVSISSDPSIIKASIGNLDTTIPINTHLTDSDLMLSLQIVYVENNAILPISGFERVSMKQIAKSGKIQYDSTSERTGYSKRIALPSKGKTEELDHLVVHFDVVKLLNFIESESLKYDDEIQNMTKRYISVLKKQSFIFEGYKEVEKNSTKESILGENKNSVAFIKLPQFGRDLHFSCVGFDVEFDMEITDREKMKNNELYIQGSNNSSVRSKTDMEFELVNVASMPYVDASTDVKKTFSVTLPNVKTEFLESHPNGTHGQKKIYVNIGQIEKASRVGQYNSEKFNVVFSANTKVKTISQTFVDANMVYLHEDPYNVGGFVFADKINQKIKKPKGFDDFFARVLKDFYDKYYNSNQKLLPLLTSRENSEIGYIKDIDGKRTMVIEEWATELNPSFFINIDNITNFFRRVRAFQIEEFVIVNNGSLTSFNKKFADFVSNYVLLTGEVPYIGGGGALKTKTLVSELNRALDTLYFTSDLEVYDFFKKAKLHETSNITIINFYK